MNRFRPEHKNKTGSTNLKSQEKHLQAHKHRRFDDFMLAGGATFEPFFYTTIHCCVPSKFVLALVCRVNPPTQRTLHAGPLTPQRSLGAIDVRMDQGYRGGVLFGSLFPLSQGHWRECPALSFAVYRFRVCCFDMTTPTYG